MFEDAIETARHWVRPLIASRRRASGQVESSLASFVVINEAGWIVTCSHVLADGFALAQQQASPQPASDPQRVTNVSYWWGEDGITLQDMHNEPQADLLVGRLEPFPKAAAAIYPRFVDQVARARPGALLCRLGYPLHHCNVSFEEATARFVLDASSLPQPIPNEGMLTRLISIPATAGGRPTLFVETSTPGLRGQSGGPLFDSRGRVWGIQSRTAHFDLGFAPIASEGGRRQVEHQFLNCGMAIHASEVTSLLGRLGLRHSLAHA